MDYKYETPFVDPKEIKGKQRTIEHRKRKSKKKKKIRRKKVRVQKYAIDFPNLITQKLRNDKGVFWDIEKFPTDTDGNFITISFIELIKKVNELIYEQYDAARQMGEKPDHQRFVKAALDKIGCFDFWSRGRICSYLSKRAAAKRKERRMQKQRRILEDARQVELGLNIPKER